MLQKLLVDQRISTSHICICLFDVHDKCIITHRLAQGKCHYLSSCTKESALQMQFLKQPQGVQRHTHLLILLRVFLTAIGSAPFQSHLKAFFHIGIRDGLICPVRVGCLELVDMVLLPVIFFS